MTVSTTLTVNEARILIDIALEKSINGEEISTDMANDIVFAINNELQLRDYVMGLPLTSSLDESLKFLDTLSSLVDSDETYALSTVSASFAYENEDVDMATDYLVQALQVKPDYPLASLLNRAINAGWGTGMFATMREELHPSVLEMLEEMKDNEITDNG